MTQIVVDMSTEHAKLHSICQLTYTGSQKAMVKNFRRFDANLISTFVNVSHCIRLGQKAKGFMSESYIIVSRSFIVGNSILDSKPYKSSLFTINSVSMTSLFIHCTTKLRARASIFVCRGLRNLSLCFYDRKNCSFLLKQLTNLYTK